MADQNTQQHTKGEVQAKQHAKAAKKARSANKRMANISKVATIKWAERKKAVSMSREANNPLSPALQERVKTGRKWAENISESELAFRWTWTIYPSPLKPSSGWDANQKTKEVV